MDSDETRPYAALYDVHFQMLRLRLMPNWNSVEGCRMNVVQLLRYIGKAKTPYWRFIRVWRTLCILSEVRVTLEERDLKAQLRVLDFATKPLRRDYDKFLAARWVSHHQPRGTYAGPFKAWNWMRTREQLMKLRKTNPGLFNTMLRNHENYRARRNRFSDPERSRFVRMMRDVAFDDGVENGAPQNTR